MAVFEIELHINKRLSLKAQLLFYIFELNNETI